jgi:hypothetical protein
MSIGDNVTKMERSKLNNLDKVTYPDDLVRKLQQAWDRGQLLVDMIDSCFPTDLSQIFKLDDARPNPTKIKGPSPQQVVNQFAQLRDWVQAWQDFASSSSFGSSELVAGSSGFSDSTRSSDSTPPWWIEYQEVSNRTQGKHRLPQGLVFRSWAALSQFFMKVFPNQIGLSQVYDSIVQILCQFPPLREWIRCHPTILMNLISSTANQDSMNQPTSSPTSLAKLLTLTQWLIDNPQSGLYVRQIPLPGIDTKFIEHHRGLLHQWVHWLRAERPDVSQPEDTESAGSSSPSSAAGFARRYGFRSKPDLVRFRILDPAHFIDGFSDLTVPAEEFAKWRGSFVSRVFVTENDVNGLAFPCIPGSLVIFGRGYSFKAFSPDHWLSTKELFYWGDIDTHGFAILHEFRGLFPKTMSLCMDIPTLLTHESQWGYEPKPVSGRLEYLTDEEQQVYQGLITDRWAKQLRLEQEHVGFEWLIAQLSILDISILENP